MRHLKWMVGLCLALCSVTVAAKSANRNLRIQHWKTDNGIPVYFVRSQQIPMLDMQVVFGAGSARDGEKAGVARLTNAMLDEGTEKLTAHQISDHFEYLGAILSAGTSRDSATLSLRSLTDSAKLQSAVKVFSELISEPSFPGEEFMRLQKQTLRALEGRFESPNTIASDVFFEKLFGEQVYAKPTIGTKESVEQLSVADLKQFYHSFYTAKNCMIAMVGDITKDKAKQLAQQIVGKLPEGESPQGYHIKRKLDLGHAHKVDFPGPQTTIMMGQLGIRRSDSRYFPLLVGNEALGGLPLNSRLFHEIRNKKGLSYYVYSGFHAMKSKGPFVIQLQTRNDQAKLAVNTVKSTVEKFLGSGIRDTELELAKKHLAGAFPLTIANNANILSNVVMIGFHKLPLTYLDHYVGYINAVTKRQVMNAMRALLKPKDWLIVTVGGAPKAPPKAKSKTNAKAKSD